MRSILQDEKICYICGRSQEYGFNRLEEHHIFEGNPDRKLSEKYGLKVWLCGNDCHRNGKNSAHKNRVVARILHEDGQTAFERVHGSRQDFMNIFGQNYL